ncbi:MAG: tetraacyldisaccharide 4'-kinase [Gammaproteobacteria bacterium]|nr:tetraacyldisaccharide 4'-kinase [Gammaproteobacteria bacterium]
MHEWLIDTWYGGGRRGAWLQPLSWLFSALTGLRRFAYRHGLLRSYRSRRPVLVIGNLTVGGTGKTPLVIWLAGRLAARGLRVGIASRGYRGAGGPARLVTAADDAKSAGDEAILLHRRLGQPVAIAARRAGAVRLLEPICDLIIADDGLQHYALQRDLEIAVVDGVRGLGNGRLLPAGPLREARGRLDEVDTIVVNGAGFTRPGAVSMTIVPVAVVALDGGERRPIESFAGQEVRALAAIGNPGRFFAMLRKHGLRLDEHALPDHAAIPSAALSSGDGKVVLMTEKDAVKCPDGGLHHAWYVEVDAHIEDAAAAALIERIVRLARERNLGA